VKVFDLRKLTSITDFFVICTGATDTQVRAIANHIADQFAEEGVKPWHIEGLERAHWVLLDFVNFVVHVFDPHTREYYGLERLWGDADFQEVRDEPATMPQRAQ
jgi:ribosome-associated protein